MWASISTGVQEGNVVLVHGMTAYRGNRCIAAVFLNLRTCAVSG